MEAPPRVFSNNNLKCHKKGETPLNTFNFEYLQVLILELTIDVDIGCWYRQNVTKSRYNIVDSTCCYSTVQENKFIFINSDDEIIAV